MMPSSTLISNAMVHSRTAWRKCSRFEFSLRRIKLSRFNDARLQAVSSRNMYSEQGLEALMRPSSGQVCHSLMVVSYCVPGSAQIHAAQAILSQSSRALICLTHFPSIRRLSCHSPSVSSASKNLVGNTDAVVGILTRNGLIRLAVPVRIVFVEGKMRETLLA